MTRRVLLYGDSNTYGTMPMEKLGDAGVFPKEIRWGGVLARELGAGFDIVVEGLGGRTSAFDDPIEGAFRNGLTILPAILHSHKPIDLLIVALGTNDQKHRFGLMAEDVALGIARLVREALASGTVDRVLVVAPPPLMLAGEFREMFHGIEGRSTGLAARIARHAGAEGALFFDAGEVISVDPLDGIHWNRAAHEALGKALAAEVAGLF